VKTGKRARTETALSAGGVSHGSAAAEVTRRVFGTLRDRTVLVVGAGEMATQTARALASLGGGRFVVANRTRERAETLARDLGTTDVRGIDEVPAVLAEVHVAVLATETWSLARREVEAALARRRAPLLLVDLGLPRVADPAAADHPGVFLYSVEDLERLVAAALAVRREAVPAAEGIVAEELGRLRTWHRGLRVHPALKSLNDWAEDLRQAEMSHLPADLPGPAREAVESLTRRLVQKLLGRPASRVVQGAETADPNLPTAEHLKSVFGLDEPSPRESEDR
jgi:glutamyl-tRNA reductase